MMTDAERELLSNFMAEFDRRFAEIFENAAKRIEAIDAPDALKLGFVEVTREYLAAEKAKCERDISAIAARGQSSTHTPQRVIASVTCGTPPASVRTHDDWTVWRKEEDARMANEAAQQVLASLQLRAGATRH